MFVGGFGLATRRSKAKHKLTINTINKAISDEYQKMHDALDKYAAGKGLRISEQGNKEGDMGTRFEGLDY